MTIATFSDRTATFPQTAATNAAGTAIIEAQHVGKTYRAERGKELTVLRDISFTLHEGEIVAILGRSGAGKSTFLRILAGLVPASSGTVTYRGTDITGPNPGVGLVFQTFALMPWLTVQANVELGLEARGVPREERRRAALQAIDAIGLDGFENAYPKELSGGMRQRAVIAMALCCNPCLLLADEPTTALDVTIQKQILNLFLELQESDRMSIMMVTHDIGVAAQVADQIAIMYGGIILECGATRQVLETPANPYTKALIAALPKSGNRERLVAIEGQPPTIVHMPPGCPFSNRCAYATEACRQSVPELKPIDEHHMTACHMNLVTSGGK